MSAYTQNPAYSNRYQIKIQLEKVNILEDKDPLWYGAGEISFYIEMILSAEKERKIKKRLPETGHYSFHKGEQIIQELVLDEVIEVNEDLTLNICPIEEDLISKDDPFIAYCRHFRGDPVDWAGNYIPGDEMDDLEAKADWELWYNVEVTALPLAVGTLPRNSDDQVGFSGPLKRGGWFWRERGNELGLLGSKTWINALNHKKNLLLPQPFEDDPGGDAPQNDRRVEVQDNEQKQIEIEEIPEPQGTHSFGKVGRYIKISSKDAFKNAGVKIGISPEEASNINPSTLRLFYFNEKSGSYEIVQRSGLGRAGTYVWGRIYKPGTYAVFGLPRDQASLATLNMFRSILGFCGVIPQDIIRHRLCQVILCANIPGFSEFLNDPYEMERLGFPDIIGDASLLEGNFFGPLPRDLKGRPSGDRPINPQFPFLTGSQENSLLPINLPLPGLRTGARDLCEMCTGQGDCHALPELQIPGFGESPTGTDSWISVGPTNIAGRVKALAIHPTDGNILYAGVSEGGIFKSNDAGRTWYPLWREEDSLSIGAIAIAPSNTQILYAGTGEYVSSGWRVASAYPGVGVYRSLNGGATWELLPDHWSLSNRISKILVHPMNPNWIYVAGTRGISRWNGDTERWDSVMFRDTSDLVMDPSNPNRIYAGIERTSGINYTNNAWQGFEGVFGSVTWIPLNEGIDLPTIPITHPNLIKLDVSRSDPNRLYARVNREVVEMVEGREVKSIQGANTYVINLADPEPRWENKGTPGGSTQRFWCSYVRVHPTDPDKIYVGGVGMAWSKDGGDTWHDLGYRHADNHDLVFSPTNTNTTYIANDGGIWKYTQSPEEDTWTYEDANDKLITAQFYNLSVSQNGRRVILGGSTQDQGILVSRHSTNFDGMGGNEGGIFEIDPNNSNIIYWDPWDGDLRKTLTGRGADRIDATDGFDRVPDAAGELTRSRSLSCLAIQPGNSNLALSSAEGNDDTFPIYRSTNAGTPTTEMGWTKQLLDAGAPVRRIVFAPSDTQRVYAITTSSVRVAGRVWRSDDAGQTWREISNDTLPGGPLRGLAVNALDEDKLYVSFGASGTGTGRVWKSIDGGVNWEDISGEDAVRGRLPDIHTSCIVSHHRRPHILFVCTDLAVFRSDDEGIYWYPFDERLPNAVLTDLEHRLSSDTLYVSTIGRGMYRRKLHIF